MRTEKELKEMLKWKNKDIVIEQLLCELGDAKDIIWGLRKKREKSNILALALMLKTNPKKKVFTLKKAFLEELWNEIFDIIHRRG